MGAEHDLVFAWMCAAGHPHQATLRPSAAQGRYLIGHVRGRCQIELDAAGDDDALGRGAQRLEAARRVVVLADNGVQILKHLPGQPAHAGVTARRTFGEPSVDQRHRRAGPARGAHEVRPQLGFHQHEDARRHPRHETRHRPREVIRRIAVLHDVAQQLPHGVAAGRRHCRHQEGLIGQPPFEGANQRHRAVDLTGRHRVNPNDAAADAGRHPPKALTAPLDVRRFAPRLDEEPQPDERRGRREEHVVGEARPHGTAFYTCAATVPQCGWHGQH